MPFQLRACGQRRRSNRPGNSQAKGPITCNYSEELLASIVCQSTEGASDARNARRESLRSRTEGAL